MTALDKPKSLSVRRVFTGATVYASLTWLFDFPLYSWVIWKLGPFVGGAVMIALSIPLDLYTFRFYDWSKQDWFAIEYLKSMKNYVGSNPLKNLMRWILTSTPIGIQVFALSFKFNSFIVTALLREGAYEFQGLCSRDWKIFWWSFFIGQLYWIVVVDLGVEGAQWLYQSVAELLPLPAQ